MEDIKILQEELRTGRSKTRSNTRPKGFYSKSCRPIIRFKLDDLDFSLKLGDIQDIKTPPLFFSIINDSGAPSHRNGRQICEFLSKANSNFKTTTEIGDGDNRIIPGDLMTKMLGGTFAGRSSAAGTCQRNWNVAGQKGHEEIKYGDGDNKTIPRDLETRMPRSLKSLAVRTLSRNLIPGYVTTKMPGRSVATYIPCTLRSSAAETLYRNLIPGDVRTQMQDGTVATYFNPNTLTSSAAGTLYRILHDVRQTGNRGIVERTTYNKDGAMNMVDKMKVEVKPTSSGTIPEIDISDRIIRYRCQDTKYIVDVNASNSTVSSAKTEHRSFSDKTEEQETPKPKKRQNLLKKFWKRITRKSKNKTESKIDEQNVKTLKKSFKLTSLMCLCQPKTLD